MNTISLNLLVAWLASAIVTPQSTVVVTLDDLFNGETITAEDKVFDNWTLRTVQTVNGAFVNPGAVEVTAITGDPLNPGVRFSTTPENLGTPWGHTGPSSALLEFSYTVQTTSGQALIKDNSLLLNGFVFDAGPNATIHIAETVLDTAGGLLGNKSVLAQMGDSPNSGDPDHFDSIEFEPQSMVVVETTIDIQGPGTNDGAMLTMFEQRFSQIPEPATLGLFGIAGISLLIRRRLFG